MYPSSIDTTMSKEMLPEKLSMNQAVGRESLPIVQQTKKSRREGKMIFLLMAAGIGILLLAGIFLLPYANSLRDNIFGVSSNSPHMSSDITASTAPLASTFKAIDADGIEIDTKNGAARSDQITLSGYSDSRYSTKLHCLIDTLPLYCDGGPIEILGLPDGNHEFRIMEPGSAGSVVRVFSWNVRS
jgi:hypothetical protein